MAELTLMLRRVKRNNQKKLDLSNKELSFIPNDVYGLEKLEILNISNNRITNIDEKIKQLTKLQVLDISNNSILDLPKEILELQNLKALIVDGNPLINKFDPLLDKNASLDIKKSLRVCFGLQSGQKKEKTGPSWLQEQQTKGNVMNNSKAFGKMVEIENKYENEKTRVKQLQKELQKLHMKQSRSSKQSFQLDLESIMEIEFKELILHQQISMGGFSTIHRGQYKGLPVAVKKIFNPKISQELLRQFSNEINMLAKFRHPNIVLLVGICSVSPNLAIVLQFFKNGSVYDLIHKKKTKLNSDQRLIIIKQMISAVRYLHAHNIAHRDIKSHNFLIDETLHIKLCDFGLAKKEEQLNKGPMQFSGTPVYMSQQLFSKKPYDKSVDIFALGTLFYEIYTGQIPYNGLDPADIKEKLMKDSRLPLKGDIPKPVLDLINRCRAPDGDFRPTIQQIDSFKQW